MKIERRVQECYKDLDTFIEAYWAFYRGLREAALLTGFQPRESGTADEEGPYLIWDDNWTMTKTFTMEMNEKIIYKTEGEEAPWWLARRKECPNSVRLTSLKKSLPACGKPTSMTLQSSRKSRLVGMSIRG